MCMSSLEKNSSRTQPGTVRADYMTATVFTSITNVQGIFNITNDTTMPVSVQHVSVSEKEFDL